MRHVQRRTGLTAIAVILQQIYKRYVDGKTQDPRFQSFGHSTTVLADQCDRIIAATG